MANSFRVIITGATGMVGEGVLHECLLNRHISEILIINRTPSGYTHPKLKEIVHQNFFDIAPLSEQMRGYDATYFCLGVSSVGKNEEEYFELTYILTLNFAKLVSELNPGHCFCYVSGAGTDSSEKGTLMWARVKGKTENALFKLPFRSVYNFRRGIIKPTRGLKHTHRFYKILGFVFYPLKLLAPNSFCTLRDLGKAMIYVSTHKFDTHTLGNKQISLASTYETGAG